MLRIGLMALSGLLCKHQAIVSGRNCPCKLTIRRGTCGIVDWQLVVVAKRSFDAFPQLRDVMLQKPFVADTHPFATDLPIWAHKPSDMLARGNTDDMKGIA